MLNRQGLRRLRRPRRRQLYYDTPTTPLYYYTTTLLRNYYYTTILLYYVFTPIPRCLNRNGLRCLRWPRRCQRGRVRGEAPAEERGQRLPAGLELYYSTILL